MKKINKTIYSRPHNVEQFSEGLISFSFTYINFCEKYPLKGKDDSYFKCLFNRLQSISQMKTNEFRTNKDKSLRAHKHNWPDTTEPEGFAHLNDRLRQAEPWQFQLSSNAHGRVHGILVDDVFYIIWFDPDHKLYS